MMLECDIEWGYKENGYINTYSGDGGGDVNLYNPMHEDYKEGYVTEVMADLKDGMVFTVDPSYAPATFTPYAGKPDLGFK